MYTEKELEKLINDVEKEFTSHLAKAEENFKLAKSENGSAPVVEALAKAEDGEKKPEEKKPEEKDHEKVAAKEGEKKPEGEAPAHKEGEAPPAAAKEGAAHAAPAEEHCDYDQEDLDHMHKMYMSMSKGELKAHHDSVRKALDGQGMAKCGEMSPSAPHGAEGKQSPESHSHPDVQKSELNAHPENAPYPKDKAAAMNGDKANGGIKGQEPANSLGAKSEASNANGAKINKSEHDLRNGGKIEEQKPANSPGKKSPASKAEGMQMEKSEGSPELELLKSELEAQKAKSEGLQKNLDAVSAFLTKLVEKKVAPAGKAITSLDVIAKSESGQEEKTLTKGEIDAKLLSKSQDPKLEKSDRDAINAFYLGDRNINSISHLLK